MSPTFFANWFWVAFSSNSRYIHKICSWFSLCCLCCRLVQVDVTDILWGYRQTSGYKVHQIQKLECFLSRLGVVFAQSIEVRCWVENEDVVGAVLTGDAPTTSEWSTILLPTKEQLILEVWQYVTSLALEQLIGRPSTSEETLDNMGRCITIDLNLSKL